jgi:hypothetical protein
MQVVDGSIRAPFLGSPDAKSPQFAAVSVTEISVTVGTKGCIGCLVDGLEHTCGFTRLPVVPSRWLRSRRH